MTRIIGGVLRGRRLTVPKDVRVRPTADRVREAWMSILGAELPGATVLDLFAGSGALGLEALSRGARHGTFVELGRPALQALAVNIASLGLHDRVTVHPGDAIRFVEGLEPGAFDLVLADPPYSMEHAACLVARFRKRPFAAILAVEHPATLALDGHDTRRYGQTAITFCYAP